MLALKLYVLFFTLILSRKMIMVTLQKDIKTADLSETAVKIARGIVVGLLSIYTAGTIYFLFY